MLIFLTQPNPGIGPVLAETLGADAEAANP